MSVVAITLPLVPTVGLEPRCRSKNTKIYIIFFSNKQKKNNNLKNNNFEIFFGNISSSTGPQPSHCCQWLGSRPTKLGMRKEFFNFEW
jgi:hypothetical protein